MRHKRDTLQALTLRTLTDKWSYDNISLWFAPSKQQLLFFSQSACFLDTQKKEDAQKEYFATVGRTLRFQLVQCT